MSQAAFPLERVLRYRAERLAELESRLSTARAALAETQQQIRALNRRRQCTLRRLAQTDSTPGGRAAGVCLRQHAGDFWLQMLSLNPLAGRYHAAVDELRWQCRIARRDVEAFERVRAMKIGQSVPVAAG